MRRGQRELQQLHEAGDAAGCPVSCMCRAGALLQPPSSCEPVLCLCVSNTPTGCRSRCFCAKCRHPPSLIATGCAAAAAQSHRVLLKDTELHLTVPGTEAIPNASPLASQDSGAPFTCWRRAPPMGPVLTFLGLAFLRTRSFVSLCEVSAGVRAGASPVSKPAQLPACCCATLSRPLRVGQPGPCPVPTGSGQHGGSWSPGLVHQLLYQDVHLSEAASAPGKGLWSHQGMMKS